MGIKRSRTGDYKKPGSFYAVNQDVIFPIENQYGIPVMDRVRIEKIDLNLPFLEYRSRDREGICHFFLDDYRFESVWHVPKKAADTILSYKAALSPDFSLFTDWPLAIQIWNVYRNRWCGKLWQTLGQTVVPTIGWSTPESFDFCFLGVPEGSVVAIGYSTMSTEEAKKMFNDGYSEMIRRINPEKIIVYGKTFPDELKDEKIIMVDTFWQRRNKQVLKAKI